MKKYCKDVATNYQLDQVDQLGEMFDPAPLIVHNWVSILIVAELIVTLGISLSCLLLNLILMGRLKRILNRNAAAKYSCEESDGDGVGVCWCKRWG